jgi:hypothetical protein
MGVAAVRKEIVRFQWPRFLDAVQRLDVAARRGIQQVKTRAVRLPLVGVPFFPTRMEFFVLNVEIYIRDNLILF